MNAKTTILPPAGPRPTGRHGYRLLSAIALSTALVAGAARAEQGAEPDQSLTRKSTPSMNKLAKWLLGLVAAACLLNGYAAGQTTVNHSFEFDTARESPDIEVLNYQYGTSRNFATRAADYELAEKRALPGTGTYGPMPPGEFLYVKWRIKSTGEVLEDRVDLKTRFPPDITDHRVHFVIDGRQLYVLLISDKERVEGLCPKGIPPGAEHRAFRAALSPVERAKYKYCYLKTVTLYPDQTKP